MHLTFRRWQLSQALFTRVEVDDIVINEQLAILPETVSFLQEGSHREQSHQEK